MIRRCPECKTKLTKDDIFDWNFVDPKGDGIGQEEAIYKCPKCECEWESYETRSGIVKKLIEGELL